MMGHASVSSEHATSRALEDFTGFYSGHAEDVLRYLTRRCLDADAAVELLAETFARAYEGRGRLRGASEEEAVAWVFGIAKHQLADYFRKGKARQKAVRRLGIRVPQVTNDDLNRIEELADLGQVRQIVAARFRELAVDQQDALRLRVLEEMSYQEVAYRLDVSEDTARARVSRGLRKLGQSLDNAPLREAIASE